MPGGTQEDSTSDDDEDRSSDSSSTYPLSIFADENWVLIPGHRTPWQFYNRHNIEAILEALLKLEWDAWGCLVWRKSTNF